MTIDEAIELQHTLAKTYLSNRPTLHASMLEVTEAITGTRDTAAATAFTNLSTLAICGQLYVTSSEIEDMIAAAASSLPNETLFSLDLLPTKDGLILFDRTLFLANADRSARTATGCYGLAWARSAWTDTDAPVITLFALLEGQGSSSTIVPVGTFQPAHPAEMFDYAPTRRVTPLIVGDIMSFSKWLPPFALAFLLFIQPDPPRAPLPPNRNPRSPPPT
jgi:hypothetical protein